MKGSTRLLGVMLAIQAAIFGNRLRFLARESPSGRTPHFAMKGKRQPRFRRAAPNGKWVMRCHRGRC